MEREQRVLDDLRKVAGPEAFAAFLEECGGQRVYVPLHATHSPTSRFAKAFGGVEEANEIIRKLNALGRCGIKVMIPLLRAGSAAKRSNAIQDALLAGQSVTSIAKAFQVSERGVYLHRRALRESGQLSLRQPGLASSVE